MGVGIERPYTEGQNKELRQKGEELIEGFRNVLRGNDVFKDTAARLVTQKQSSNLQPVNFSYGGSDYKVLFGQLIGEDSISLWRHESGASEPSETLTIGGGDSPILVYVTHNANAAPSRLFGFDAVGAAQKLLDGLKPGEKS